MNNNYNENTSVSAYRMFEVLKFLMQKPASVQEIKEYLEKLDNGKIYSKNVIYKYLTTLKFAGMNVKRNKCKYEITKFPFKFDFSDNDLNALSILNKAIDYVPENEISDNLKTLFYRLNMRFTLENKLKIQKFTPNTNLTQNLSTEQKMLIETYNSYCKDNYRYTITMKNLFGHTEKIIAEPIETYIKDSKLYLKIFCTRPNRYLELNVEQIIKIEETKKSIADTLNESQLHQYIMDSLMRELYEEVHSLYIRTVQAENDEYKKSLESNNTETTEE